MTKVQPTYASRSSVVLVTLLWGQAHELCFPLSSFQLAFTFILFIWIPFLENGWEELHVRNLRLSTYILWYCATSYHCSTITWCETISLFSLHLKSADERQEYISLKQIHPLLHSTSMLSCFTHNDIHYGISLYGLVFFPLWCTYFFFYCENFLW